MDTTITTRRLEGWVYEISTFEFESDAIEVKNATQLAIQGCGGYVAAYYEASHCVRIFSARRQISRYTLDLPDSDSSIPNVVIDWDNKAVSFAPFPALF